MQGDRKREGENWDISYRNREGESKEIGKEGTRDRKRRGKKRDNDKLKTIPTFFL